MNGIVFLGSERFNSNLDIFLIDVLTEKSTIITVTITLDIFDKFLTYLI